MEHGSDAGVFSGNPIMELTSGRTAAPSTSQENDDHILVGDIYACDKNGRVVPFEFVSTIEQCFQR